MRHFIITFDEMIDSELYDELTPAIEEAIKEVLKEYDEDYHDLIHSTAIHAVTMIMVSLYYYARPQKDKFVNQILLEDGSYIDAILITMRSTEKIKWREV